jgi:hypothetical protein
MQINFFLLTLGTSANCKNDYCFILVFVHVGSFFVMEQLSSQWTDFLQLVLENVIKSVEKIQLKWKSDLNNE